jgi:putative SOS response-associated peptidase YedK
MCGKFTQMASWAEVVEYANLFGASVNDSERLFTPMRAVPVVHLNDGQPPRLATPMVWGFTDRKRNGFRVPKHMHARGETVDRLPTFAEAFRYRRGITFAKTFNEGKEIDVLYDDGTPNGKKWTQQWVMKPKDGKPIIIAVIYDMFHVDPARGDEFEFVQVTTPANASIEPITDRMPLLLREEDVALWLGETNGSIEDVKALIKTFEFDPAEWDIIIEDPSKKPPRPRKPKPKTPEPQGDLF